MQTLDTLLFIILRVVVSVNFDISSAQITAVTKITHPTGAQADRDCMLFCRDDFDNLLGVKLNRLAVSKNNYIA